MLPLCTISLFCEFSTILRLTLKKVEGGRKQTGTFNQGHVLLDFHSKSAFCAVKDPSLLPPPLNRGHPKGWDTWRCMRQRMSAVLCFLDLGHSLKDAWSALRFSPRDYPSSVSHRVSLAFALNPYVSVTDSNHGPLCLQSACDIFCHRRHRGRVLERKSIPSSQSWTQAFACIILSLHQLFHLVNNGGKKKSQTKSLLEPFLPNFIAVNTAITSPFCVTRNQLIRLKTET
jgi:hypothetical protein